MSTLIEKHTRLQLLAAPIKKVQMGVLIPLLLIGVLFWFIPSLRQTGLFTTFALSLLALGAAVREVIRLQVLKQRLAKDVYRKTVLKVARVSMIGSFIPILPLYVGTIFPQYAGISFTVFLVSIIVAYLIVSRLNKQAKQLDPAFVTMREIERYRK
ncbi:hypothetical protein [Exiguobacterium sp. s102]|uniref:hypothetical protein n=1 Tax=Exiguobacterium sp. s102 TaxID=2751212 RepID=UPI001BE8797F